MPSSISISPLLCVAVHVVDPVAGAVAPPEELPGGEATLERVDVVDVPLARALGTGTAREKRREVSQEESERERN